MPLSTDMKIEKLEKKEYPPLPENIYTVELLEVTEKIGDNRFKPGEKQTTLTFQFTLLEGKEKDGSSLRGRNIWHNYTPNYLYVGKNGKNALYQILEALLKRELDQMEQSGFTGQFINNLIGAQCRIVVKNKKVQDKVFSNIESFLSVETALSSLDEKEKEQARVKEKKEDEKEKQNDEQNANYHQGNGSLNEPMIDVDAIPF